MSDNNSSVNTEVAEKKTSGWKVFFTILFCALIGFLAFYGGKALYEKYSPAYNQGGIGAVAGSFASEMKNVPSQDTSSAEAVPLDTKSEKVQTSVLQTASGTDRVQLNEEQIFEQNVNSVVSISTEIAGYNYFGQPVQGAASGSGFIVTEDGVILTNYHVIEDATAITVLTYSGDEYPATVRGYDSSNDIAVLEIDAKNLKPVTIGDSDLLKEGQHVVAIGNALGEYGFSITEGIVSGLSRDVRVAQDLTMSLIQTDCAVNSGNSGGPLFNAYGDVIGIVNAKLGSSGSYSGSSIDNIGFAIPINSVHKIVLNIIENSNNSALGDVAGINTPFLGIAGDDVDEFTLKATGLTGGAKVTYVYEGSAAAKAGMQADDIILKVNGEKVADFEDLKDKISKFGIGDDLTLTLFRSGKEITVTATLTAKSEVDTSSAMTEEVPQEQYEENPWGEDFDIFDYIFGNY